MTTSVEPGEVPARTSALRVGAALGGIVLAAVVVFGLGVMVGKRVAESVPPAAAPPAALPTEHLAPQPSSPPPAVAAAVPPERLTFYDRLSGAVPPAPPLPEAPAPAGPPPAPAVEPPGRAAAAAGAPGAAPAAAPAKPALSRAARAEEPATPDPGEQIKKLAGRGRFSVQVASATDRAAAEQTAARLKRQGFEVVTVMASIKGRTWYRIRVGNFPNQQAATKAADLFRSGFGLNAIPVRE